MTAPEVATDLTPASTTPERAIRGTFTVLIEHPNGHDQTEYLDLHTPRLQALTYAPRLRALVTRDQPHRGQTLTKLTGYDLTTRPDLDQTIEVLAIDDLEIGKPLGFINEYGEHESTGIVVQAWMVPESPHPTISRHGERIVFDGDSSAWRTERGGVR